VSSQNPAATPPASQKCPNGFGQGHASDNARLGNAIEVPVVGDQKRTRLKAGGAMKEIRQIRRGEVRQASGRESRIRRYQGQLPNDRVEQTGCGDRRKDLGVLSNFCHKVRVADELDVIVLNEPGE